MGLKGEYMIKKIIKVIKILLIIMVYVIMFWGLIKWISYPFTHKTEPVKCECTCNCGQTESTTKESENEISEKKEPDIEETAPVVKKTDKEPPLNKGNTPTVKKVKTASKETYQAFAYDLVINQYLWSQEDYEALVKLWTRESDWNPNAVNKSSGACNIPQALPCNKISKAYGDNSWESGIKWGLSYIKNRYGNPRKAWQHFQNKNWY